MLYIIKKDYFLADYVLSPLEHTVNTCVIPYHRSKASKRWGAKILFSIRKHIRAFCINKRGLWTTRFFPALFLEELKKISPEDHVLFWGVENLKEMLILQQEIDAAKISFFLWNPVSTINRNPYSKCEYAYYIRKQKLNVYTFDKIDTTLYGLKLVNQVYRKPDKIDYDCNKKDLFFIGKDKGRVKILSDLLDAINQEGLSYYFHIVVDKHTKSSTAYANFLHQKGLLYSEVLKHITESKCIVEIIQAEQSGMTIRTLEALFFKKKLITNNQKIIEEPFYQKENIYIIGKDEKDTNLTAFINSPFKPIPQEVIHLYQVEYWIKQFIS